MFVDGGGDGLCGFWGGTLFLEANATKDAVLVLASTHSITMGVRWYGTRVHANVALFASAVTAGLPK